MEAEAIAIAMRKRSGEPLSHEVLWKIAEDSFYERLNKEEGTIKKGDRDILNQIASPKDAIQAFKDIQSKAESEYSIGVRGQATSTKQILKEKFNKVVKKMQSFAAFGDVTMKFCPESVGLVWAGLRVILQMAFDDMELCDLVVEACDEISSAMLVGDIYHKRYAHMFKFNSQQPADSAIELTGKMSIGEKILDCIARMYSEILYFSYQTRILYCSW